MTLNRTGILRTSSFNNKRKPNKTKCKVCRSEFKPTLPKQVVCGVDCSAALAVSIRLKNERKEAKRQAAADRAQLQEMKSNSELADDAQKAVNKYVNLKCKHLPCICCGKSPYEGVRHAGHYKSRGSNSFLRFHLWNIHTCCYSCNVSKSGNIIEYRPNLIKKIGIEKVEFLENAPRSRIYSDEYLIRLKKIFQRKCARLIKRIEG